MQRRKAILGLFALGALAAAPRSQEAEVVHAILREGDTIVGVGAFNDADSVRVNDHRSWVSVIDTDYQPTSRDAVLLRNWLTILREGNQLYSEAPGDLAILSSFDAVEINADGDLAMLLGVGSTEFGSHTGFYWNGFPVLRSFDPIVSPGFGVGSHWTTFKSLKANANNQVMIVGEMDNTSVNGTNEDIIAKLTMGEDGSLVAFDVLARNGLALPALEGLPMATTDFGPHASGFNKRGDWIAAIKTAIGVYVVKNGDEQLGREGGASVLPGRNWRGNAFSLVFRSAINDRGETMFVGAAEGNTSSDAIYVIVKNGELWVREGNVLPEFSNRPIGKGTSSPLILANTGDVYWFAQDSGSGKAYMRNFTPILKQNESRIEGNLVTNLPPQSDAFDASDDGRFWIGRVDTQVVGEQIVFADFGLVLPLPGCQGNPGELSLVEGRALAGDHLLLGMDNGQDVGVTPILQLSTQPRFPGNECGVLTQYGEILISPADRFGKITMPVWNGVEPSTVDLQIPSDPAIIDATVYIQGVFWDAGNQSPEVDYRLSNALKIEIGAP
jgi:hypothetical protein